MNIELTELNALRPMKLQIRYSGNDEHEAKTQIVSLLNSCIFPTLVILLLCKFWRFMKILGISIKVHYFENIQL